MREILFKAKRIDNGEWVEGLLTVMWGQYHIINSSDENTAYPIDTDTICQYTGLTDKNGNKIWENDVVNGELQGYKGRYIIKWMDIEAGFSFPTIGRINENDYEVIGNIFDNPELLK